MDKNYIKEELKTLYGVLRENFCVYITYKHNTAHDKYDQLRNDTAQLMLDILREFRIGNYIDKEEE